MVNRIASRLNVAPSGAKVGLDLVFARSIAWTSGVRWFSQILSWCSTLVVARFLTPADYGLVGMASVYLALVALFNEFGLGAAIITKHELTHDQIAQINSVSVLLGLASFGLSCLAAVPLSLFFGSEELRWILPVMGVSFIFSGFGIVPNSLLERDLEFKSLALIESIRALVGAGGMLALALIGIGYWALVLGGLIASIAGTTLLLCRYRYDFAWPRVESLKETIAFSWNILVSRFSWYLQSQMDFVVAARVLGQEALGAYTIAWAMAAAPTQQITGLVLRVTFPLFSAIKDDVSSLRRYLLILSEGLALVAFPAACGLAFVADDFVYVVLGEKWLEAIAPLRLLSWLIMIRAIVAFLPQLLFVTGESRFAMKIGIGAGILLPVSFYIGSRWGIIGIAAVWVTVYPIVTLPLYWRVFQKLELSVKAYFRSLSAIFASMFLMGLVLLLAKELILDTWSLTSRLSLQVFGGAFVYVSVMFILHGERVRDLYQGVRRTLGYSSL